MVGKLMLIGLGDLGFHILQFLARTPGIGKVVVADIDEAKGLMKKNDVIYGAAHQGFYPDIEFKRVDLFDLEGTAEVLGEVRPDVLCQCASLLTWWKRRLFPTEIVEKINEIGSGPWIPINLTLAYKLMQAIKKSGIDTKVVNCSYPDAVNSILDKVGLSPTVGGGNFDLAIPRMRKLISSKLKVPMCNVSLFMVGHHGWLTHINYSPPPPFWVKVLVGGTDVSYKFTPNSLRELMLQENMKNTALKRFMGPPPQQATASSFLKNMLAIYFDTGELTHAPGPNGLPGGYPVRLSAKGAEVVLPKELTIEEAIRINEEGARWDGIENITKSGKVLITEKSYKLMKDLSGYDCKEFSIEESEEKARELLSIYRKIQKKYK